MIKKTASKSLLMCVLVSGLTINGLCQNMNFVNYSDAPMLYNPAMISSVPQSQAHLNYRNTKLTGEVSSFSSMVGLLFNIGNYTKANIGTVGISAYDDRSNYALSLKNTGLALAYSQPVQLTSSSFLSIGIQCNLYQKSLDFSSYTTGTQWNSEIGFDPTISNGEEHFRDRIKQYTLNTGLYWQKNNASGKAKLYGGFSIYNINRPEESFTGKGNQITWRYFAHGGYCLADNNIGRVLLDATWLNQENQNVSGAGLKAGMYYGNLGSGFGLLSLHGRILTNNTVMAGASVEQKNVIIGISYDFISKTLYETNTRSSAFEVYARLKFGRSEKKKSVVSSPSPYQPGQKRAFLEERQTEVMENFPSDSAALKKVENVTDTSMNNYVPVKIALKRDFKFAFNDAALNNEAKQYLDELVTLMNRNKNITIEIIGHTDDVGTKEGNRKISLYRAQVVADYMESKGIDKKRITITGKMDSEPLFPNTTPENRARNRRVEFIIMN